MSIRVAVFSPAGKVPAKGDYFTVMEQNLLGLAALTEQLND
jgi:hypothetical protein